MPRRIESMTSWKWRTLREEMVKKRDKNSQSVFTLSRSPTKILHHALYTCTYMLLFLDYNYFYLICFESFLTFPSVLWLFLLMTQGRRKQFWSGEAGAVGKAHSTLGGPGACPPLENFENLHCLRLILRQSGRYFKYCWLKAAPASPTPTALVSQEQKVGRLWVPQPPLLLRPCDKLL